jgi:hypothetical protein
LDVFLIIYTNDARSNKYKICIGYVEANIIILYLKICHSEGINIFSPLTLRELKKVSVLRINIHNAHHREHSALPLCRPVSGKWVGELLLYIVSIMANRNFMGKMKNLMLKPGGHIVVS